MKRVFETLKNALAWSMNQIFVFVKIRKIRCRSWKD